MYCDSGSCCGDDKACSPANPQTQRSQSNPLSGLDP